MNDKTLRLFLAVADSGSFSRAEAGSYISKQAILKQMDALEAELELKLFVRSNHGVQLTEAGRVFYQGAKKLLDMKEKLLADCRKSAMEEKVLRIGNVEHQALLTEVTEAYALKYPDVRIQRIIHPIHSGEYRVEHGIMDVAETFYSPILAKMAAAYTPLIDLPYRAVVREGHPLARRRRVALSELCPYRTVVFRPMIPQAYLSVLQEVFHASEQMLDLRIDVDNQVPVAFECLEGDDVLLTANYFIYHLPHARLLPLTEGWKQEYGILYRTPTTPLVQKYVDLAVALFKTKEL